MRKPLPRALLLICAALPAGGVLAHPDAMGTRFVAASGQDQGDCDSNHRPCRTLQYALTRVNPGDAIKLAAGTYDLSSVDAEGILLGKEGVRGGYSAEDHFAIQDAESNPTYVTGVTDEAVALNDPLPAHETEGRRVLPVAAFLPAFKHRFIVVRPGA